MKSINTNGIRVEPKPYCPKCGATMVLRRPKGNQRWRPFLGYPDWPDCDGKRQIGEDGLPEYDDEELQAVDAVESVR